MKQIGPFQVHFCSIVALLVGTLLFSRDLIPIGFTWRKELNRKGLMLLNRFSDGNRFPSFSFRFLFAFVCVMQAYHLLNMVHLKVQLPYAGALSLCILIRNFKIEFQRFDSKSLINFLRVK